MEEKNSENMTHVGTFVSMKPIEQIDRRNKKPQFQDSDFLIVFRLSDMHMDKYIAGKRIDTFSSIVETYGYIKSASVEEQSELVRDVEKLGLKSMSVKKAEDGWAFEELNLPKTTMVVLFDELSSF